MYLFDRIRDVLQYFGLVNKRASLLIMGIDNAGKSTFLNMMRDNVLVPHHLTSQIGMEEITIGDTTFQAYDTGGRFTSHHIWRQQFSSIGGIVFMVDAADTDRLPEAREELKRIMTDEKVANVPILVLGNKIDRPNCCSKDELMKALELDDELYENSSHGGESLTRPPYNVVMCSIVKRLGYGEGFKWLANQIQ